MEEVCYKLLIIGDVGVGKTSLIRRYTKGKFTDNCKPTIGVDFALKTLQWDNQTLIRAQLWDIAGQERFGHMTRVYYKDCSAAIVVFDVTRPSSFEGVMKWKNDLDLKCTGEDGGPVPCILIANKMDLTSAHGGPLAWKVPVSPSEMNDFCKQNGFLAWFSASAKDGQLSKGFDEGVIALLNEVRNTFELNNETDEETERNRQGINLTPAVPKSRCWCS